MKTVIREIIAMIILVAAIILVTITFFFDYIKDQANQPQSAVYKMSDEESTILKERQNYINSQNKIVLSSAYYPVPFQQGADFCIFSPETSVQDIRIFGAAFREDVFTKRTGCLPVEDSRLFEDRESIGIQDFRPFIAVIAG